MGGHSSKMYAFNRTRKAFLASEIEVANTHWTRLKGLLGTHPGGFCFGRGLWIVPCHGVHTLAMRYPIDVVYLDGQNTVVQVVENLMPWRIASIRTDAMTVLELPSHTIWNTGTTIGDEIEITRLEPVNK